MKGLAIAGYKEKQPPSHQSLVMVAASFFIP